MSIPDKQDTQKSSQEQIIKIYIYRCIQETI